MKIHIYRPYFLSFSFRNYKILDSANKLIGLLGSQSEAVIDQAPSKIKLKVDWYAGSYSFDETNDQEKYLICYFSEKTIVGILLNFRFKNLIKLKEVSKAEYEEAISTKGNSLSFYQGAEVSKLKSIVSRVLSGVELLAALLLFYQTDYSENSQLMDLEFMRFIALLIAFGGVFGLIWNINKYLKIFTRVLVGVCFIGYAAWEIQQAGGNGTIFLIPITSLVSILALYLWKK
ncbi:hypothetical protein GYB57_08155 [bacterium]|jgi:hypothetical protein|nr:hypothetical protein [bacterium]